MVTQSQALELAGRWLVQPTISTDVANTTRIAHEQVSGPVLSITPFDEAEAVAIAKDAPCRLAAEAWPQNARRAVAMSERLRAGAMWVNTCRAVSLTAPFSGSKRSSVGCESDQETSKACLQTKSVWIGLAGSMAAPFVPR